MAVEEPEARLNVEFGAHVAFAVLAAVFEDLGDPVEHQHWRQRQLRISRAEQLLLAARQ